MTIKKRLLLTHAGYRASRIVKSPGLGFTQGKNRHEFEFNTQMVLWPRFEIDIGKPGLGIGIGDLRKN